MGALGQEDGANPSWEGTSHVGVAVELLVKLIYKHSSNRVLPHCIVLLCSW